jgi:ubiquinone biosynthesis monooxygenase Coq6
VTSSLKIALIETQDLSTASTWELSSHQYSNRTSSITPASKAFLDSIGAWQHLDLSRVQAYHGMQVWDGVSGSRIEFDWQAQSQAQDSTIAYMVENANTVRSLLRRLESLGGFSAFDRTKVTEISLGNSDAANATSLDLSSWPHLSLSSGERLACRLLIGADGLNSPVRNFADIPSRGWDYERHGVVATLKLNDDGDESAKIAYQRFLPTGPVALLPLPGPYATLVWSTLPSHAARLKSLSPRDFLAMVNAAFRLSPVDLAYMHTISSGQEDELSWRENHTPRTEEGRYVPHQAIALQEASVASFPLRMRHADSYTASRVALVGDAAHTIHPLAGQGLNMGIGDAEALVRTIEFAVAHGQDIGDQLSIENYNAERYAVNNLLLGVVDKLHKLYAVGSGPLVGLRSWGLEAVNGLAPLKKFFMNQAAGIPA